MYWLEAFLGVALIVAPFAFGYRDSPAAFWASIAIGVVVLVVSGYKAYAKKAENWEAWVLVVAGLVAILVPFVLGFSEMAIALWTFVFLGILIALISGVILYAMPEGAK